MNDGWLAGYSSPVPICADESVHDRLGLGRIEILTKPGTDRFRGQVSFNFNDDALNARNPFADNRPAIQTRQYGGNFGGPISKKKASFFIDFDKRDIDDASLIVATVLDANNNIVGFRETFPIPSRRTTFSPRIDYQLNANNTLVGRYNYTRTSRVTGVGGFSLPTRAYDTAQTEHSVQLTETSVISKTIVNETRFQFQHSRSEQDADNSVARELALIKVRADAKQRLAEVPIEGRSLNPVLQDPAFALRVLVDVAIRALSAPSIGRGARVSPARADIGLPR